MRNVAAIVMGILGLAASGNSYPAYLGGPAHTSYVAAATTVTVANAGTVGSIWDRSNIGTFTASPIVNSGIVYIGSENGTFYALNAATGATIWSRAFAMTSCSPVGHRGFTSTATATLDSGVLTVYVGAPDHYLYALNANNGHTIWRHLIGEKADIYYNWSSPTVADGFVYYGVSTACDQSDGIGNPGYDGVIALHQSTGKLAGQYFTGGCSTCLGASVHTSVAVDPDGNVWVSTGNDNGTAGTDATAIVELGQGTLTRMGGYQVPGLYGDNSDFMASPVIFDGQVGACNKDGVFYVLNQSAPNTLAWAATIGTPPAPDSLDFCGDAAVYDGSDLFIGGNPNPNASSSCAPNCAGAGYVYELTTSGAQLWSTPVDGPVVGGVSLDGSGVLAVPTYNAASGVSSAVYLIDAANGTIERTISTSGPIFAQPVFADNELLVAGSTLQAYAPS
jgi:outer membrane protein assembly factor BamB